MRRRVREVIVVEGRYDKNALLQVVDATVVETRGFGIFKDREMAAFLRRLAAERGIIVLTDSDGAGFLIRGHLRSILPAGRIKQAYIPDVAGKERRKRCPGREGKLGVEGMSPAVLLQALERAGATFEDAGAVPARGTSMTKADLLELGLAGPGSAERRQALQKKLDLPAHLTANGLLEALNLLYSREEVEDLLGPGESGAPEQRDSQENK